MKPILLFAALLLFLANSVQSQTPLNSYIFQNYVGAYPEINGGILLGTEANDDQRFVDPANPAGGTATIGPGFPIGFNFIFGGVAFDRIAINNNGWISLGQSGLTPSVNIATSSAYLPISSTISISPGILVSRISALGLDLQGQPGSELRLETVGASPNMECVIQWKNYREYGSTGQLFNFQIRLLENGNEIRMMYGNFINNAGYTAQVGLRGEPSTPATNYHNRTTTTNWMATIQGGTATANCTLSATVFPAPGTTFVFTPPSGPPACANLVSPSDLASQVPITASLNWSAGTGGVPDYYKLFLGTDNPPTNLHNGTIVGMATSYDPIPDMNYLTPYFWKIVPVNANGEAQGCPIWSFTTGPDPTILVFPACESFEVPLFPPYGWTSIKTAGTGNPGTWDRQTSGTYPACAPHTGAGMTRYNSYNLANGTAGILVSPPVNFPSDLYRVEFWMYRDDGYPAYNNELVNVYYNLSPDLNGATLLGTIHRYFGFDPVESTANQWYKYHFDMPPGSMGMNRYVVFEAVSQYGNNMFIDDICLDVQPLCQEPTSLSVATTAHTALLGWNSSGTQWEIEYGATPYIFTGNPTFTTGSNPHLLGNLASNTSYVFKVRNVCQNGILSPWSVPYPFTTSCDTTIIPYTENFDNVIAPAVPVCITVTNNNGDAVLWKTVTSNPASSPNAMNISYNTTLAMDDWFFSRGLWLNAGSTYEVKFSYRAQSATYPERLQVLWGTAPDAGSMTGGMIWDNSSITNVTYSQASGTITPATSGTYYVGWHGYSVADMYQLYVDDISVTQRRYYSVHEVYTDMTLQDGDSIWVTGDCSNPEDSLLLESYMDFIADTPMPPYSSLLLEGASLPDEAWYGGYVALKGAVRFIPNPDPYPSSDTIRAIFTVAEYHIYIEGYDTMAEVVPLNIQQSAPAEACDPCKFAIMISGGVNTSDNHSKYFKNLAELYKYKVDHDKYCPENIFVHYFQGTSADTTKIPQSRVIRADKPKIQASFAEVAKRVKACDRAGKRLHFKKW
ncbi:MAG: fibronectin type III domain-containing protein [Bacteroidales bacterium]|nr:fibronectin type III domain-containing protein [Bacteroidales bacterium]